jgi:hypothetical protein
MTQKCPMCGFNVAFLYKCGKCGDIRCDSSMSNNEKGACGSQKSPTGKAEPARDGGLCKICKNGKYVKL